METVERLMNVESVKRVKNDKCKTYQYEYINNWCCWTDRL